MKLHLNFKSIKKIACTCNQANVFSLCVESVALLHKFTKQYKYVVLCSIRTCSYTSLVFLMFSAFVKT